jgi:hypothetical protein
VLDEWPIRPIRRQYRAKRCAAICESSEIAKRTDHRTSPAKPDKRFFDLSAPTTTPFGR